MHRRRATCESRSSTLAAYLRAIARVPRLTLDEEQALGARIHLHRDEAAVSRLVESNLRFVACYARRYRRSGVSRLDIIHAGNLGLIEAAWRFDPSRHVKFISYAVWWIRNAMRQALADQTRAFSYPPRHLAAIGWRDDLSLGDVLSDGARPLGETLAQSQVPSADELLIHESDLRELTAALDELDGREHEVMRLRFGLGDTEPSTLQEIGDRLHLSRERVRQIEAQATDKLRRSTKFHLHVN